MNYCKGCKYAGLDGMDCYSCSAGSNYVPNELESYKKEIAELEKEKCELLGIIQAKDKLIEKMKN